MYHYTECGLPNVWLVDGFKRHDTPYGEAVEVEDVAGLHRAIGLWLITRKPHLTGSEFRFLRKELDMSQSALAAVFGNDAQSVALWEKRSRGAPKMADRFLRALYRETVDGKAQILEMVKWLNDMDGHEADRLEFTDSPNGWRSAA